MLSFFPRDLLDEILNLIESVSEGFSSYSCINSNKFGIKLRIIHNALHGNDKNVDRSHTV